MTVAETLIAQARERFAAALCDILRSSGYRMPEVQEVMARQAAQAFDELAGLRSKAEYTRLRSLTASRISLVHPEDMDLTVQLINLSSAINDTCEHTLGRLHLLFMTLLEQSSAAPEQLPVGTDAICAALRGLLDSDVLDPALRPGLPERIETPMQALLPDFYSELLSMLQTEGVTTQRASVRRAQEDAATCPTDGALARLQAQLQQRHGGAPAVTIPMDPTLLAGIMDQVYAWLARQQQEAAASSSPARTRLGELGKLLPPERTTLLEALEDCFDTLRDDATLPATIRPALERLRLPTVKAALREPNCLGEKLHPVLRLLEVALRLARTLPLDVAAGHPVCQALIEASLRVQRDYGNHSAIFEETALHLEVLEQDRIGAVNERTLKLRPLAEREARREHSRTRAARAIRALCASQPPLPVSDFLENVWVRVLAAIQLRNGEKSPQWHAALTTANKLVDSVQPRADVAERRQLAAGLPALIAELRAGLEAIGAPPTLRETVFTRFADLHTATLRGQQPVLEKYQPLQVSSEARVQTVSEIPGLYVVRLPPASEMETDEPEWVGSLQPGEWFCLTLPGQGQQAFCLAWQDGNPRLLLAATPDGLSLLAPMRWLLEQARAEQARRLSLEALFEQTAAQALARGL
ncbi:MAG: hypothetical protein CGU28_06440 [Candidatus Dactylopiibacterium carminicum]|nr:MAG: hypothetical protein CGU28_06440 [Candidatus Dactylopiibacterium carminicum]